MPMIVTVAGCKDFWIPGQGACLRILKPNVIRNIICYIWTVTITDHSVSRLSRAEASHIVTHLDF